MQLIGVVFVFGWSLVWGAKTNSDITRSWVLSYCLLALLSCRLFLLGFPDTYTVCVLLLRSAVIRCLAVLFNDALGWHQSVVLHGDCIIRCVVGGERFPTTINR